MPPQVRERGVVERLQPLLDEHAAGGARIACASMSRASAVCHSSRSSTGGRRLAAGGLGGRGLARLLARRTLGDGAALERPGGDRLGHLRRGGEALVGRLRERAQQRLVVGAARARGAACVGGGGRLAEVLGDEVGAEERRPARERLEQRHAERVEVGGEPDRRAGDLLGRHVRERADEAAGLRLAEVDEVGAAEVAELGVAGDVEEDVGRLDVAVDDAALVRGVQRRQQVERQPPRGRAAKRPPAASRSASVPPAISSNTNRPAAGCASCSATMFGWRSRPTASASRANRRYAWRSGSSAGAADQQELERDGQAEQRVRRPRRPARSRRRRASRLIWNRRAAPGPAVARRDDTRAASS